MTLGGGFRRLTRVLRRLEDAGWAVECVRSTGGDGFCDSPTIRALVDCRYAEADAPSPPGTQSLGLAEHPVRLSTRSLETTVRGVKAKLDVTIEVSDSTPTPEQSATQTPLHRDRNRLLDLYRRYPTFSEMAEAVDEDISDETIRRYTIEHGIHEPGSRSTGGQPVLADGMGVSADLPLGDVIDAVAGANTVYEVQRTLDLEREKTTALLRDLELMDLVTGRIETMSDRDQREREIRERLIEDESVTEIDHRNG